MIKKIRQKSKELLKEKKVELILGYKRASDGILSMPAFIDKEEDVVELIWDSYCVYNLSNYLKDFTDKKVGIIAKACDVKSIMVLLQESQLKKENIFIIGVECSGVIDENKLTDGKEVDEEISFDKKCKLCKPSKPLLYDVLISQDGDIGQVPKLEEDPYEDVRKLEVKSLAERFKFWKEEFSRCIRCYACRQVCPMCYCPKCVADQTQPAWFSKTSFYTGNFSWNVTRAMHLAGRCIGCNECERVCPVGLPLISINKKIEKDVKQLFDYEAGSSSDQKPLLSFYDKDDPEDFIR